MWQEIIITDVTRMSGDRVCVAGVDHNGHCLRPLLPYPQSLQECHLYDDDHSVLIRPRAVLNMFLEPELDSLPPHSEDHLWTDSNRVEFLRYASDATWKSVLEKTAYDSVTDIFETPVLKNKRVAPGTGSRSLGTLKPVEIVCFSYHHFSVGDTERYQYRLSFTDSAGETYYQLPITDLTLRYYVDYLRDVDGLYPKKIRALIREKLKNADVWLRLGLTRPFKKSETDQEWCYLQVTGIYTFPDYLAGQCFADFKRG
jgi:hypothetical protein